MKYSSILGGTFERMKLLTKINLRVERSADIDDRWQASVDRTLVAAEDALPRIQIPHGNLRSVGLEGSM